MARRRRGPNLLEGIGGFGVSFASGIANQWNRMDKSERDKYDSVFDYVQGKENGATAPGKTLAPVETPAGQSNPPDQTKSQAGSVVPQNTFGIDSTQDKSFIDSGSESATEIPSPVPDQPAMSESSLPDDAAYEEEMRRLQQQAQQEYSNSFNDFSGGDSNGS